ncbi:MAG: dUTP diphosphatase [Alphaproteobacteria bacterium]|nr:dUTP diphosphatase [Alphaproteobacteria bacterium]
MTPAEVTIRIQTLPHGTGLTQLLHATPGSAGLDLAAAISEPRLVAPGARELVPCGLALAMPFGVEAQIRPRSGLALRFGVTVLNSPGTIDSDYRGEIQVLLINHGTEPFQIQRGDRIAQMVFALTLHPKFELCDEDEPTPDAASRGRAANGFGSTGISWREEH